MAEFLSTHEVAEYLRMGERKVYELLRHKRIPASRVAGKWLFPRALIDLWVLRGAQGIEGLPSPGTPPPVIAGSHDPLLEWAVRESGCELALMFDGSMDGLSRLATGRALACGLHLPGSDGEWNRHEVADIALPAPAVMLEWAWREQGLILPAGNPRSIRGVADLAGDGIRVAGRQTGAGSRVLLEQLLAGAGVQPGDINFMDPPARSENDVARAVLSGQAAAGLGIRSTVITGALEFLPLERERYDLLVSRRDCFEPPMQALLAFSATARFAERAAELGGYDVSGCGRVRWNSPAP